MARAAERVGLARRLAAVKQGRKLPTVDYEQERVVLDRTRTLARERGLDERVAEDLLAGLVRASVTAQDEESLRITAAGEGKRAVIVGGAGRMGRWWTRFLAAQGYRTGVLDPAANPEENERSQGELGTADLVVCSTPPSVTVALYAAWRASPPRGVVLDIASIKTPLVEPIRALRWAGGRVGSMHPMFGPSTVLLRDADVVVCDTGDREATEQVERLFAPTTARLVRIPLEEHDRVMADLLSLAHATSIAFALALPRDEHPVRSTTFQALEKLAGAVVRESPDVYYEIQAGNPHSIGTIERLGAAVDRIVAAVRSGDAAGFRDLMAEGRERTRA